MYRNPIKLHKKISTMSHIDGNKYLDSLGYVHQQKGGFWNEHRRFMKETFSRATKRKNTGVSKFTGRWERENRNLVKKDYLQRIQNLGVQTAVCLPSVSAVKVVRTFRKFDVNNIFGFEKKIKEYKTAKSILRKAGLSKSILLTRGDIMDHLSLFKKDCFVEADFCGKITSYKNFFKNLPQYWSITVTLGRFGDSDKVINYLSKYLNTKLSITAVEGGSYIKGELHSKELGKLYYYKYRDPSPQTGKCFTMMVITNF